MLHLSPYRCSENYECAKFRLQTLDVHYDRSFLLITELFGVQTILFMINIAAIQ